MQRTLSRGWGLANSFIYSNFIYDFDFNAILLMLAYVKYMFDFGKALPASFHL